MCYETQIRVRIHFICHLTLFCVIFSGAMVFEWNLIAEDKGKLRPFL